MAQRNQNYIDMCTGICLSANIPSNAKWLIQVGSVDPRKKISTNGYLSHVEIGRTETLVPGEHTCGQYLWTVSPIQKEDLYLGEYTYCTITFIFNWYG